MALSGHIGEPWHKWTPEKIEMSYPVLPIVWVKNTSEEARNCLSLLGKHLLSTSLGTCLESDVVSYLQPLLRMELCTCAVWQGTWPTWCKSLGHTCHHMSHSTSTMLQHSPARLQTERHKTCQQFQSIVFSIYLCDVCQCYILTYGLGVHICH